MLEPRHRSTLPAPERTSDPVGFLPRIEHQTTRFIKERAEAFDGGAVLPHRYADQHGPLLRAANIQYVIDLESWALRELEGTETDSWQRIHSAAYANAVKMPLTIDQLQDPPTSELFTRDVLAAQTGAIYPSAAYFTFESLDDPWLEVNLECAKGAQRLSRKNRIAVWIRGDLQCLLSGDLGAAAPKYREALGGDAIVFLSTGGFDPNGKDQDQLASYLRAVALWTRAGFDVVADRVEHFGVFAAAAGAVGASFGTRGSRTSIPSVAFDGHRSAATVRFLAPKRGDLLSRKEAYHRRGRLAACPVKGCEALQGPDRPDDCREHLIHQMDHDIAEAIEDPDAIRDQGLSSTLATIRAQGEALRLVLAELQDEDSDEESAEA